MKWSRMKCSRIEWNGMEWNGVKWNEMEWNRMEWKIGRVYTLTKIKQNQFTSISRLVSKVFVFKIKPDF